MKQRTNLEAFWDGFTLKVFWDWYDKLVEPKRFLVFIALAMALILGNAFLGSMMNNPEGGAMGGALVLLLLAVLKVVRRRG